MEVAISSKPAREEGIRGERQGVGVERGANKTTNVGIPHKVLDYWQQQQLKR